MSIFTEINQGTINDIVKFNMMTGKKKKKLKIGENSVKPL